GIDRGTVRGDAGVPFPAPAEVADDQPVAAAGLAYEPLLGDPEPVVEPVGERERGRCAVGEGGRIGRRADDEDLAARQRPPERDRRQRADLPRAGDDDPSGHLARRAHGTSASRSARETRYSRWPGIASTSRRIASRSESSARASWSGFGSAVRGSCRSGITPWPR